MPKLPPVKKRTVKECPTFRKGVLLQKRLFDKTITYFLLRVQVHQETFHPSRKELDKKLSD